MRIVAGMTTHIDHAVDRGGSADHLASRTDKPPPAKCRFRFCQIAPVIAFHIHRIRKRRRHLDQWPGIAATKFQNKDASLAIRTKTIGKGTAGRTRADNDIVINLFHAPTIWPAYRRVKKEG